MGNVQSNKYHPVTRKKGYPVRRPFFSCQLLFQGLDVNQTLFTSNDFFDGSDNLF
jgi:hypothetical protein